MRISDDLSILVKEKTVINSGSQIEIITGNASIIMKKNGDIRIKGKNLTLAAQAISR
jgi:type VI secretion system secreted protein VgrG